MVTNMAISSGDILFYLTTPSGSAGNTNAGTNTSSLGKYCSNTQIVNNTLENLFLNASGDQNAASVTDYRAIYIVNNNPSGLVMQNTVAYFSAEVSGGANVRMAVDNVLSSGIGSSTAQMALIASPTTAPSNVGAFSFPVTKGTALSLGNIASGSGRGIWIARDCVNSIAVNSDGATLKIECDSAA